MRHRKLASKQGVRKEIADALTNIDSANSRNGLERVLQIGRGRIERNGFRVVPCSGISRQQTYHIMIADPGYHGSSDNLK